jgi:serine protease
MRCLCASLLSCAVLVAQQPHAGSTVRALQGRTSAADPLVTPDPSAVYLDRLNVKLREGCGAELRAGKLTSRTGVDLAPLQRWFERANATHLITALTWDELDAMHREASAALPAERAPGHLGLWFRLTTATAYEALELHAALAVEPLVEHVYHEARLFPASAGAPLVPQDIPPPTPPFMALQQSHDPSPLGHGLRLAAGILGARGQGVGLRMIEGTWLLDHEDVSQLVASSFVGPVPPFDLFASLHGLSGAALICADRNNYGITGVADEVTARFIGVDANGGFENCMALMTQQSQPGDVILVVLMVIVPSFGPVSFVPVEFMTAPFQAVQTATALGRHVVMAGGNGNLSLDDPLLLGRFDRGFRDSGSILVGSSAGGALQRAAYSNWGSRIDAHSWGDFVVTCGYGTLFFPNADYRQSYTAAGTGTSSSTPHLAGIVALIQAAHRRQRGQSLTNAQLLALLHTHGPTTPDMIGRRPDVPAIFQALGVFDGLRPSSPDVPIGGTVDVLMDGPNGSLCALFGSVVSADLPLGFNRNLHLDPAAAASLGAFFLPTGTASWQLVVPNTLSLSGVDVYFQGVRLVGSNPLYLTNSCQITVL